MSMAGGYLGLESGYAKKGYLCSYSNAGKSHRSSCGLAEVVPISTTLLNLVRKLLRLRDIKMYCFLGLVPWGPKGHVSHKAKESHDL